MRTTIALTAALILCATAATAADSSTQFSILSSNLGYGRTSSDGGQWDGGIGLALSHAWTSRWSTEAAVAYEQHRSSYVVSGRRDFHVFPIDLTAQYRFTSGSAWTPYFLAGVRRMSAPAQEFGYRDRTSAEVGIGTGLRVTPHFGLRFDVTRLLRNDGVVYDPVTRASVGVSWKF